MGVLAGWLALPSKTLQVWGIHQLEGSRDQEIHLWGMLCRTRPGRARNTREYTGGQFEELTDVSGRTLSQRISAVKAQARAGKQPCVRVSLRCLLMRVGTLWDQGTAQGSGWTGRGGRKGKGRGGEHTQKHDNERAAAGQGWLARASQLAN